MINYNLNITTQRLCTLSKDNKYDIYKLKHMKEILSPAFYQFIKTVRPWLTQK